MTDCRLCGDKTLFEGTKLCSRCWELEHRIQADVELAIRIVTETLASKTNYLTTERDLLLKLPCACGGPCDEEGLVVEHQCNRCARLEAIGKEMCARAKELSCLTNRSHSVVVAPSVTV